ncbi:MAG: hypothetical protein M3Z04_01075 [Chloroflexota bacterium]|nr:hypothetical protein [Chloroflexota bacterium]
MTQRQNNRVIWGLIAVFSGLVALGWADGWGSPTVHILGVLGVLLGLFQALKRRGTDQR